MKFLNFMGCLTVTLTANVFAFQATVLSAQKECSPPLGACRAPVKWIADKNDCSCFACEYGKPKQHTGCTRDNQVKADLLKLQNNGDQFAEKGPVPPFKILEGIVVGKGDKTSLVSDKDGKHWDVVNPDELKGHEGRHVQVKAYIHADGDSMRVADVKETKNKDLAHD